MGILTGLDSGVRLRGPVTNLAVAGVAAAAVIFQVSTWTIAAGGQMVGAKSVRIKRITGWNSAAGNTTLHIGTGVGAAFVALLPPIYIINGMSFDFGEGDLPEAEAFVDITAYPLTLVAAGAVNVQVEVEEIG